MIKKYLLFLLLTPIFCFSQGTPVVSISGQSTVCSVPSSGGTYTAFATNSPTAYQWGVVPSSTNVIISNPTGSVTNIAFIFTASNNYYLLFCSATNAAGTGMSNYMALVVMETPNVIFSGNTTFCKGSSTFLQASPTLVGASSTINYTWTPNIGLSSSNSSSVIANPPSSTNYTVQYTMGICSNTTSVMLLVDPCTGLNNFVEENNSLKVYPNPSSEFFYLSSSFNEEAGIIVDALGRMVVRFEIKEGEDQKITGLRRGIYFVITRHSRLKIVVE